jgi:NADPH:quinone reductase-like Zn-dependent oxidoreductase
MAIPEKMFGVVLTGHGGLDKLEWREDLDIPQPGEGEVLIRVLASSVNNTDINTRTAWYSKSVRDDTASVAAGSHIQADVADGGWSGAPMSFPRIQGADCCGEIVAVGAGVPTSRIGDRVLVRALQSSRGPNGELSTWTFGCECDGAFAQFTKAFAAEALSVRSDWTDAELASIPCAYSTAQAMLQKLELGAEQVLVTGASGGVGLAAVQLAKLRGAHVTAMTSAEKAEVIRSLGADSTVTRDDPLGVDVFDAVVDVVAGPRWPDMIGALRRGGRYVTSGAIAGPIVELDVRTLYLRDLTLFGSTLQPDNVFVDVVRHIERGELRPQIAKAFDLKDLRKAQSAFLEKRHVGKIVIRVAD